MPESTTEGGGIQMIVPATVRDLLEKFHQLSLLGLFAASAHPLVGLA